MLPTIPATRSGPSRPATPTSDAQNSARRAWSPPHPQLATLYGRRQSLSFLNVELSAEFLFSKRDIKDSRRVPAVGAAHPGGRRGGGRGRWARFPRKKGCTGGSRRWLPALRLVFSKRPSSFGNLRGRNWVRTSDPSLVRRNNAGILSSYEGAAYKLDLRKPCLKMPWGAWRSAHGGSRKWFPEQRRGSPL
jgi:hypothetical protein